MQINHNINAMVTKHALYTSNNAMSKSLEKLSTGLRINRAQDDAAGLAMSEQMRTQIRGLGKAKQNAQDGIGLLQIAEGGLQEITNIMQRQRELAVQAANDTLTSTERDYLNREFQQLTKEISRISLTTNYNGKNLLNYTGSPNKGFGAVSGQVQADGSMPPGLTPDSMTLHIGPNYGKDYGGALGNELTVSYAAIQADPTSLGNLVIGGVNIGAQAITTQNGATAAIDALDDVIKIVNSSRATIGSYINRLEFTINNIANLEFNTQDAESRIRDTDFSYETTQFTRNQIMVQAGTSMLSQANSLPQSVLGLLG